MKSVAISKLKASLSEYVNRVKSGDEVLITDRGVPVAKLCRVSDLELDPHVHEMARKGLLRMPKIELTSQQIRQAPSVKDPHGKLMEQLLQDRKSGW